MSSKIVLKKRPVVVPALNTVVNIMTYINIRFDEEIKQSVMTYKELIQESTNDNGKYRTSKYISELSQEHIDKKDKYFMFYINMRKLELELLNKYIIEPKVAGQILLAKRRIKELYDEISSIRNRKHEWCIPH